jgi:hypothetical protein
VNSFQFSVFSSQFGGAGAGAWDWVFGAPFAAALGGRECLCWPTCFWGVLPPHPRPLSPVGGEGGFVVSFQFGEVGAGARRWVFGAPFAAAWRA